MNCSATHTLIHTQYYCRPLYNTHTRTLVCPHNNNYVSAADAHRHSGRVDGTFSKCVTLETSVPTRGKKLTHVSKVMCVCHAHTRMREFVCVAKTFRAVFRFRFRWKSGDPNSKFSHANLSIRKSSSNCTELTSFEALEKRPDVLLPDPSPLVSTNILYRCDCVEIKQQVPSRGRG